MMAEAVTELLKATIDGIKDIPANIVTEGLKENTDTGKVPGNMRPGMETGLGTGMEDILAKLPPGMTLANLSALNLTNGSPPGMGSGSGGMGAGAGGMGLGAFPGGKLPPGFCLPGAPTSDIYIQLMGTKGHAFLGVCTVITFFVFIISLDMARFVIRQIHLKQRRNRILWIIGLYPVFSATSLLAIYIPRSALLTNLQSSMYLSIVLYQFVLLVMDYYGGGQAVVAMMKNSRLSSATFPCLCCFVCLPSCKVTEKSITLVKRLVLQVAFVQPTILFITAVLWTDGMYTPGKIEAKGAYLWLTVISLFSNLLALHALVSFFRASREPLRSYQIGPKFCSMQLVLILCNIQGLILGFLTSAGVIECIPPFNEKLVSSGLYNMLVIIEMFLIALLARCFFRKRTGNLSQLAPPPPSFMRPTSAYFPDYANGYAKINKSPATDENNEEAEKMIVIKMETKDGNISSV